MVVSTRTLVCGVQDGEEAIGVLVLKIYGRVNSVQVQACEGNSTLLVCYDLLQQTRKTENGDCDGLAWKIECCFYGWGEDVSTRTVLALR